jgi:hypothetical protein
MKRLPIVALAVCFAGLVACNQASAGGSFNQQARLDNLEKDFKQVKEEFEIIKYALDKRGISLEQARAEMEADNKVWDIPDEDSRFSATPRTRSSRLLNLPSSSARTAPVSLL